MTVIQYGDKDVCWADLDDEDLLAERSSNTLLLSKSNCWWSTTKWTNNKHGIWRITEYESIDKECTENSIECNETF